MKTTILSLALMISMLTGVASAQDRTTVNAHSSEISDNLDLRAVASIFGDSEDLADFERRLNDPKLQISNLDLNRDDMVDYLRVIESVEGNTHLIIIQSVIGRDLFQDVATVEVERDSRNRVQIQVVGDVYMYGQNYIYEPIYVHRPIIYNTFWIRHYRPYVSSWYWGYYPTYFYAWNPYPVHMYYNNVNVHINNNHYYNYVNIRRSQRAVALHSTRRANAYEMQNPNRSFAQRNNVANRYELTSSRSNSTQFRNTGTRTATTATQRSQTVDRSQTPTRVQTTRSATSTTAPTRTAGTTRNTSYTSPSSNSTSVRTPVQTSSNTRSNYTAPTTRSATTTRYAPTQSVRSSQSNSVRNTTSQPVRSTPVNLSMNSTRMAPTMNRAAAPSYSRSATQTQRSAPQSSGRR